VTSFKRPLISLRQANGDQLTRKSTCVGGLAQERQTTTSLQSMKYRKYASDLAYLSVINAITVQVNRVVVLEESPRPRGSSRTNLEVLVLVLGP